MTEPGEHPGMGRSGQLALIVLGLSLVVGLGLLLWGTARKEPAAAGSSPRTQAEAFAPGSSSAWTSAGNLLTSLGPKLKLERDMIEMPPGKPSEPILLSVPADAGVSYRIAKFRLRGDSGRIEYRDVTPQASDDVKKQLVAYPAPPSESSREQDRMLGSILVMQDGGKLSFYCTGSQRCVFELE